MIDGLWDEQAIPAAGGMNVQWTFKRANPTGAGKLKVKFGFQIEPSNRTCLYQANPTGAGKLQSQVWISNCTNRAHKINHSKKVKPNLKALSKHQFSI